MTQAATFVYVTYIRTTPDRLWAALTDPDFMRKYWFGMHIQTDWKPGSAWSLLFPDGRLADGGQVVEADPPRRLALTWQNEWDPETKAEGPGRLTMVLEPCKDAVKLSITHVMERPVSRLIEKVSGGWPKILSNLKSLLETGATILE
jgi:uncharacterized protein YndB with AHSA1/START domain